MDWERCDRTLLACAYDLSVWVYEKTKLDNLELAIVIEVAFFFLLAFMMWEIMPEKIHLPFILGLAYLVFLSCKRTFKRRHELKQETTEELRNRNHVPENKDLRIVVMRSMFLNLATFGVLAFFFPLITTMFFTLYCAARLFLYYLREVSCDMLIYIRQQEVLEHIRTSSRR